MDHYGEWVAGFAGNLWSCSSAFAELHANVYGLELTWDKGCQKIILECDSNEMVDLMAKSADGSGSMHHLLRKCCLLLDWSWEIKVKHIYKETNFVADGLALLGKSMPLEHHILRDPPPVLISLLEYDILNTVTKRYVFFKGFKPLSI